ncbi:uncharacterized protein LOC129231780 [Uloborus diversus]|uniref:uncharacterized protein LOC129231780 n=1 Tax=Uloborus diversus TaxID=327109 RepID=UPI00240A0C62|nr:uncharacterized protein LOC129231780 [Uloborus diversus]
MAGIICCLSAFLFFAVKFSSGIVDLPYFYDPSSCYIINEEDFDDLNNKRNQFDDKPSDVICLPLTPSNAFEKNTWKGCLRKSDDVPAFSAVRPMTSKPHLGLRKRSLDDMNRFLEDNDQMNSLGILQPMVRLNRNRDSIKTVHLQSSFTPRLGRKRSEEKIPNLEDTLKVQPGAISSRSRHVINLNAGTAFTPRLGRSQELRATLKFMKGNPLRNI